MKNNKKDPKRTNNSSTSDNYKLNTSAVDRLVDASKGKVVEVDEKEVNQYKSGKLQKIPTFIKAIFIKWWFAGAACFFFLWGLGTVIQNQLALLLVLGFGLGIITNMLANNLLRFLESSDREYDKWILFPWRKWWTIFLDVIFSFVLLFLVVKTYDGINALIIYTKQLDPNSVPLGVEPFLFGIFYIVYDLAIIWLRNLIIFIINKIIYRHKHKEEIM